MRKSKKNFGKNEGKKGTKKIKISRQRKRKGERRREEKKKKKRKKRGNCKRERSSKER